MYSRLPLAFCLLLWRSLAPFASLYPLFSAPRFSLYRSALSLRCKGSALTCPSMPLALHPPPAPLSLLAPPPPPPSRPRATRRGTYAPSACSRSTPAYPRHARTPPSRTIHCGSVRREDDSGTPAARGPFCQSPAPPAPYGYLSASPRPLLHPTLRRHFLCTLSRAHPDQGTLVTAP